MIITKIILGDESYQLSKDINDFLELELDSLSELIDIKFNVPIGDQYGKRYTAIIIYNKG